MTCCRSFILFIIAALLVHACVVSSENTEVSNGTEVAQKITCQTLKDARKAAVERKASTPIEDLKQTRPLVDLHMAGARAALLSNRKVMLEALRQNGSELAFVPDELKADREIVLEAVKQNGRAWMFASNELKTDPQIVLEAVKTYPDFMVNATEELRDNEQIMLEAVKKEKMRSEPTHPGFFEKQDTEVFRYASARLRRDPRIVLEMVANCRWGYCAQYMSEELKANRTFVREALKKSEELSKGLEHPHLLGISILHGASDELKADREFMRELVNAYGYPLVLANSSDLKADRQLVLKAVKVDGCGGILQLCSPKLRADREVALEAVRTYGWALECLSDDLKADEQIVLEALKQFPSSDLMALASNELRANRQFVLEAVKTTGDALDHASTELKVDRQIMLEAVKHSDYPALVLEQAPEKYFANDREIMLVVLRRSPYLYHELSADLKSDRELALTVVKWDCGENQYSSLTIDLRADLEIWHEAMKRCDSALLYAPSLVRLDRSHTLEAVKYRGGALRFADLRFKADRQVVLEAVQQDGHALVFAAPELQADRHFIIEAVKRNATALLWMTNTSLLYDHEIVLEAIKAANTTKECVAATSRNPDTQGLSLLQHRDMVLELARNEVCYLPYPMLPKHFLCDEEIAMLAVRKDPMFLEDACDDMRANAKVVQMAVQQDADAWRHASPLLCPSDGTDSSNNDSNNGDMSSSATIILLVILMTFLLLISVVFIELVRQRRRSLILLSTLGNQKMTGEDLERSLIEQGGGPPSPMNCPKLRPLSEVEPGP